jgi:hypothetical protein
MGNRIELKDQSFGVTSETDDAGSGIREVLITSDPLTEGVRGTATPDQYYPTLDRT